MSRRMRGKNLHKKALVYLKSFMGLLVGCAQPATSIPLPDDFTPVVLPAVWTVSYASHLDRFEEMLHIFDLSMLTFKYAP
jgi:hypothetical protein